MKIDIPTHWNNQDIQAFLKMLVPDAQDKEMRNTMVTGTVSKKHCYRGEPCNIWIQTGTEIWQGHCGLYSTECINAAAQHKNPPMWRPKVDVARD